MKLSIVPPAFIDLAWGKEGANCLAEALEGFSEITGDQLKMILSRGERTLVRLDEDDKIAGWGCYRVDQLPNLRALHITDLVSHNNEFHRFFEDMKVIAMALGCSEIRCSCKPAQAHLFKRTNGFEEVYMTLRVKL
jgi:hypothetical protein